MLYKLVHQRSLSPSTEQSIVSQKKIFSPFILAAVLKAIGTIFTCVSLIHRSNTLEKFCESAGFMDLPGHKQYLRKRYPQNAILISLHVRFH